MAQKPSGRPVLPPSEVLGSINAGLDGYSDPTTTNYKKWYASNNVFSGPFNFVQRARFANVITSGTQTTATISTLITGGGNVLVTTTAPHGFAVNQYVVLTGTTATTAGFPVTFFNGIYFITAVTATTFTAIFLDTFLGNPVSTPLVAGNGGVATISAAPGYFPQGTSFTTLKYYSAPTLSSYLMADNNGKLFSFDSGANYAMHPRINSARDPTGAGSSTLNGPWSRETLQNILYEMNGQVKQSGRGANAATVENWGLDAPDATPQIVISAGSSVNITNIQRTNGTVTVTTAVALTVPGGNGIGMINVNITTGDTTFAGSYVVLTGSGTTTLTFAQLGQNTALLTPTGTVDVNITKSIGRSYAWAWENANKPHVSAPSPSSQYVLYNGQNGVIQCIQQGTAQVVLGSANVVGVGTAFTSAWVGRNLYIRGTQQFGPIASVQSATQMTLRYPAYANNTDVFQVFDPQATHIRLYETADGGATYFRTQRNAFNIASTATLVTVGLQFFDNANSEPPNFPFTSEISQLNNVPPPIGAYIAEYQGVLAVFGVPGAPQSFFYSNQTLTTIGQLQESYAPLNQYTLPIQNASLNGWIEMPGAAILWSNRQDMYRLTGLLTDNTAATAPQLGAQISRLPYNLGCVSPFAVDLTPLGAIWVTPQAEVWLFTNTYAPRNIGRPIQNILNSISQSQLSNIRVKYYHNNTRNWLLLACATGGSTTNNTLLILDLDQLASNGSPSFFVFDMATNQPTWYQYTINCQGLEVLYEPTNNVRLLVAGQDAIQDADFTLGYGTEIAVTNPYLLTHPWGNDSVPMIKRPSFLRFHTNRDPSILAIDGWSFEAFGIDDDYYTLGIPLSLTLTPGVNDTTTLCGNPLTPLGSPFRHSPELFRIGSVNFVMGRRIQFQINFPTAPGVVFQFRQIQIGFAPSPPR
jgi:hypothetical protein